MGKTADFDWVHVDLPEPAAGVEKPEWYQRVVNPYGTVPTLVINGTRVFDSLNCATYLCERYESALWPADLLVRADVRLLCTQWGEKCGALWAYIKGSPEPAAVEERAEAVALLFGFLEHRYANRASASYGPWFLGEQLSLADMSWITLTMRLALLSQEWFGRPLVPNTCPRVQGALAAAAALESFQASYVPDESILRGFEKMRHRG